MNSRLQSHFDELNKVKDIFHSFIEAEKDTFKYDKPSDGGWNATQILQHMQLVEASTLSYMQKKLQAERIARSGFVSLYRSYLLKVVLALPIRFKVPLAQLVPAEEVRYYDVLATWKKTTNELYTLLASLPDRRYSEQLFKHPLAGRINAYQAIDFLRSHHLHHFKQLKRLKAAA